MKVIFFKITKLLSLAVLLTLSACSDEFEHNTLSSKKIGNNNEFCNFYIKPFAYTVCEVKQKKLQQPSSNSTKQDLTNYTLSLAWRKNNDNLNRNIEPYRTFNNLKADLSPNQSLIFAVNAGMYNQKYAPIGYTIIEKEQVLSLNLNKGKGNFHLMPNGVFWWDKDGFYITESNTLGKMLKNGSKPSFATQSGPMLVIKNQIHPQFRQKSKSKKLRNGVGICTDGTVKFVNSQVPVNFFEFASLYKNRLGCKDALFLDGGVASALYSNELNENNQKSMGVMIVLIKNNHDE